MSVIMFAQVGCIPLPTAIGSAASSRAPLCELWARDLPPRVALYALSTMTTRERPSGSTSDTAAPTSDDEATPAAVPESDEPVVRPVPEKIGEGGTNLQDREAALGRRRSREKPSP